MKAMSFKQAMGMYLADYQTVDDWRVADILLPNTDRYDCNDSYLFTENELQAFECI